MDAPKRERMNVRMTIGGEEIKGSGSYKMTSVPWYKRWWFNWTIRRVEREMVRRYGKNWNDHT